jgi:hypothetical protein
LSETETTVTERLDRLARRLEAVEDRLGALERHQTPAAPRPGGEFAGAVDAAVVTREIGPLKTPSQEIVPLIGRTLMVLGGGFALRAMTEGGVVPQVVGTMLGIGYALVWLMLADRAAGQLRRASAVFHGLAATAIVYPLLWEATARFGLLSGTAGAVALLAVTLIALGIAARRDLLPMAWAVALAATGTSLALGGITKMLVLFVSLILTFGLVSLILAYRRGWLGLARFLAVVADLSVLMLTVVFTVGASDRVAEVLQPIPLVVLQLALVVGYLGTYYVRALLRHAEVTIDEILQGAAALLVGLGGAIQVTHGAAVSTVPLGVVSLGLAAMSYTASFAVIDRAMERRHSFIFFTTTAMVFTLVGFGVMFDGATRAVAFAAVGFVATWIGGVRQRATLSLHGAVYVTAAAISVGLFKWVAAAFSAPQPAPIASITPAALFVIVVAGVCGWFQVATHGKTWGRFSRAPKLMTILVFMLGLGAILVTLGSTLIPTSADGQISAGALATLRTAVLALAAVALALLGRWSRLPEAAWLVYPVLAVGGLKLLLEDVRGGQALTLFISFALYGGALILSPRLARRRE